MSVVGPSEGRHREGEGRAAPNNTSPSARVVIVIWSKPTSKAVDQRRHAEVEGDDDPDRGRESDPRRRDGDREDDQHRSRRRSSHWLGDVEPRTLCFATTRRASPITTETTPEGERWEDSRAPPNSPITAAWTAPARPAATASDGHSGQAPGAPSGICTDSSLWNSPKDSPVSLHRVNHPIPGIGCLSSASAGPRTFAMSASMSSPP